MLYVVAVCWYAIIVHVARWRPLPPYLLLVQLWSVESIIKSSGAEAESYLDLPRTRTWNLLMTTFGTEMIVFRSQVRYPITPADPLWGQNWNSANADPDPRPKVRHRFQEEPAHQPTMHSRQQYKQQADCATHSWIASWIWTIFLIWLNWWFGQDILFFGITVIHRLK